MILCVFDPVCPWPCLFCCLSWPLLVFDHPFGSYVVLRYLCIELGLWPWLFSRFMTLYCCSWLVLTRPVSWPRFLFSFKLLRSFPFPCLLLSPWRHPSSRGLLPKPKVVVIGGRVSRNRDLGASSGFWDSVCYRWAGNGRSKGVGCTKTPSTTIGCNGRSIVMLWNVVNQGSPGKEDNK